MEDPAIQQNPLDVLMSSATIPREIETALRERLGLPASGSVQGIAVGGVYINTTNVNPATELGYGVWTAIADGKVLVGYKSGDSDFGTMAATGGEKTHVLTTTEMPAHHHSMGGFFSSAGGSNGVSGGGIAPNVNTNTQDTGGDGAHNNLQPFLVVAIWKRTS